MAWAALSLPASAVIAFFHGSELGKFERSLIWRFLMRRLYARVDGYAVASHFVENLVRANALTDQGRPLRLAPCAVPNGLADLARGHRRADNARLRLLTVGRLHPRKGQLETARALSLLPVELRQRIIYSVVGRGDEYYRRLVESACAEAGVRCEFSGGVTETELAAAYGSCDIYIQSSLALARSVEGFGISYLEAAAFGCPCVGVATGGVGEAVINGVTGLLTPEGDLRGFAGSIARLLEDASLRRRMGEAGRQHAAAFDWERSARALLTD